MISKMQNVRGVIFDIDGVLTFQGKTYAGAVESIEALRSRGMALRFLTNSTLKSRRSCAARLRAGGFELADEEALTASYLSAAYLRSLDPRSILMMLERDGVEEFVDFVKDEENPEFVVIGDNRSKFDFEHLNLALRLLKKGAKLIGMTAEILDTSMGDLELNVGSWVRLLEVASGVEATYIGKPCPFAYQLTLADMSLDKSQVVAVGDRINTDILGARNFGLRSVLVKSGEFEPQDLDSTLQPDYIIDRIDQILDLLLSSRPSLGGETTSLPTGSATLNRKLPVDITGSRANFLVDTAYHFLFSWHDEPKQQVNQDSGHAAGDQGDQESEPEPESADPKEFSQSTAHTGEDALPLGAAKFVGSFAGHFNLHSEIEDDLSITTAAGRKSRAWSSNYPPISGNRSTLAAKRIVCRLISTTSSTQRAEPPPMTTAAGSEQRWK